MSSSWQQTEYELQHGLLWAKMNNGRYWCLRQNGKVKLWKKQPFRWEIPIKAGMFACGRLTSDHEIGTFDSDYDFICSQSDPNTCSNRKAILASGNYPRQRR